MGKSTVSQGATGVERPERQTKPACMVLFRPHDDYKGEFGFDWLRTEDNGLASEPDYETILKAAYKNGIDDHLGPDAFKILEREYKQLLMWKFAPQEERGFGKYYVPYLNLFSKSYSENVTANINPRPPYEAKLKILVEIKLEYNPDVFLIDEKKECSLQDTAVCPLKESQTISITCLRDISSHAEILTYAYYEDHDGEIVKQLAGKIIAGANDAKNRKEVKFVFVCVQTDISGIDENIGKFPDEEQSQLRQTFQALIRPLIWVKAKNNNGISDDIVLDLRSDPKFKTGGMYVSGGNTQKGSKANSLETRPIETIPHEALHGFQLFHTHRDGSYPLKYTNIKYIYPHEQRENPLNATDDVMSYRIAKMWTTWN